ncbi:hypothetical protein JW998_12050 [candidate division KSB1 bacterium]|nr:hypothetical protein [candidate division KSB1 bacterium]
MKRFTRSALIIILTTGRLVGGQSGSMTFITASSLHARSVAMGGAFTAMEAGPENALFNPAAMGAATRLDKSLNLYVNPVGLSGAILQPYELSSRVAQDGRDWLSFIGLLARAFSYSRAVLQASVILTEELPLNPHKSNDQQVISTQGILDWNYHTAAVRLTLARQVSLGLSGYCFNLMDAKGELGRHFGSSYGILMKPSDHFAAGISYFNFPAEADSLMVQQHRIINKSINLGFAYRPRKSINLALDFRNVSEENNNSTNEVHAGVEIFPSYFFALRGGFFRQSGAKIDTFSLGCGLSDFRPYGETDGFVLSNIILNYGLQAAKQAEGMHFVHYLTFLLRF